MNKITIILEIIIFITIVLLDAMGVLPISQTIYLVPFIWLALRIQKEGFKNIGMRIGSRPLWQSILIGIVLGIVLELFAVYVTTPVFSSAFGAEPSMHDFQSIKGNFGLLLLWIVVLWVLAAFGEEICFRGFLMNRFAKLFGGNNTSWVLSLIFSSMLFGWGHTEQGITGWVQECLSGLFLGIIFLASGRNLVIPIVTHGISNTLALVLIYMGSYPGIQ